MNASVRNKQSCGEFKSKGLTHLASNSNFDAKKFIKNIAQVKTALVSNRFPQQREGKK
jgi:hypothetical protein